MAQGRDNPRAPSPKIFHDGFLDDIVATTFVLEGAEVVGGRGARKPTLMLPTGILRNTGAQVFPTLATVDRIHASVGNVGQEGPNAVEAFNVRRGEGRGHGGNGRVAADENGCRGYCGARVPHQDMRVRDTQSSTRV